MGGREDVAMQETQHDVVRREFGQQAPRFGEQGLTLSNQAYLDWMVEQLDLQSHFGCLMWPPGRASESGDRTACQARRGPRSHPEMLAQGEREAEQQGLTNVVFEQGEAEHLTYGTRPLTWWSHVFRCITSPMRVVRRGRCTRMSARGASGGDRYGLSH